MGRLQQLSEHRRRDAKKSRPNLGRIHVCQQFVSRQPREAVGNAVHVEPVSRDCPLWVKGRGNKAVDGVAIFLGGAG